MKPEGGGSSGSCHGPGRNPVGASARPYQLLAQGGEGLLLGQKSRQAHLSVRYRHRAELLLRRGGSQGEALEDGEPQGPGDAAAQIGPSGLSGSAAGCGADQGFSGHLDQILPLHQREEAPGGGGSQGNRSAEAFR